MADNALIALLKEADAEFEMAKQYVATSRRNRDALRGYDRQRRREAQNELHRMRPVAMLGLETMKYLMDKVPESRKMRGLPNIIGPWRLVYRPDWPDARVVIRRGGTHLCTEFLEV